MYFSGHFSCCCLKFAKSSTNTILRNPKSVPTSNLAHDIDRFRVLKTSVSAPFESMAKCNLDVALLANQDEK